MTTRNITPCADNEGSIGSTLLKWAQGWFYKLYLKVATGTAPMEVTSTTKVDNLNVDMVDGKHDSDLIGTTRTISTTTPLSGGGDLSVDRTFSLGGLASIGTADYIVKVNHTGTAWEYQSKVIFDIRDYGASPSASAVVNTAAIQAAITACPVGGTVFVPEGTYLISSSGAQYSIAISLLEGRTLRGEGYKSIIKMVTPHCYGIGVYDDAVVEDIALQGDYTHTTYPNESMALTAIYHGGDFYNRTDTSTHWYGLRAKVRRVKIYDWGMNAISPGPWWAVEDCYISHCFNEGILCLGGHARVLFNYIEDVNSWGIDLCGNDILAFGNELVDCGDRIALGNNDGGGIVVNSDTQTGGLHRCKVIANTVKGSTHVGIQIIDTLGYGLQDTVVAHNTLDDVLTNEPTFWGTIDVRGTHGAGDITNITVADNTIRNTTGTTDYLPLIFLSNVYQFSVSGNKGYGTTHFEGIMLGADARNFSITGNVIKNCHTGFALLSAGDTALYGTVANNDFDGNSTPIVYTTGTFTEVNIYANSGDGVGICFNAGRVGFGTIAPAVSALIDMTSTTGSLLLPRMTTTQRDALTAVNGMIIYNSTTTAFNFYENGAWATK